MINWYRLSKGTIKNGIFSEKNDAPRNEKKLIWYHCLKPGEKDLALLSELVDIPYEVLQVALDEEVHPYVEKDAHLELVYRAPVHEAGDIVTDPLVIFLKGNTIITLARSRLRVIHDLKRRCAAGKGKHLLKGSGSEFIRYLIDEINDDFLKRIENITATIDLFEEENTNTKNFQRLYDASLTSAHFNQALLGNIEVLNLLRKLRHRDIKEADREGFYDLYLDARQLLDTEKIQRELITNLFTLQNVMANQKVEKKLQQLTILAIIITVPTMISGLYGMNLAYLPLASHPFAFWILCALMLVAILLLIPFFRSLD